MSGQDEYRTLYKYRFRLEAGGQVAVQSTEMTQKDIQEFVNASLGLMTARCEECARLEGRRCEKHKGMP